MTTADRAGSRNDSKGIKRIWWEEFALMWVNGETVAAIQKRFGASFRQVQALRLHLGLTDRGGWSHGASGYTDYWCRCVVCTRAHRERAKRRRQERVAAPKDPNDPRHGTRSFYINHGCRCEPCTQAHSAGCNDYYRRRTAA